MDLAFTKLLTGNEPDQGEDSELRPLDWAGLCARLAAVQQLRRELERHETAARASFAPISMRLPSGVNPEPLADGKAASDIGGENEVRRDNRIRGQQ